MKYRYARILIALTLMFTWLGFRTSSAFATGGCSGLNCQGLDPGTMGCPAVRAGILKLLPDTLSTVETRKSGTADCNAKWARTYNLSGVSKWVAADIKCGGGSYPSCQFRSSAAKIASSSTVGIYTPMTPFAATQTKSCGVVRGDPGPITTVPQGTANCTLVN
jgi:hypothetical protein